MPFIEVKASGPDIPDGSYPVILFAIEGDRENHDQPRHVVPEQGPNAGKDLYFWDWKFSLSVPGHPLDNTEIEYSTSTASGSKSNMYKLLTALLNGVGPQVGVSFEKTDLVGRMALASIQRDQAGYCRITGFVAMPASMMQATYAAATGAPQAAPAAPAPVAAPVAAQPAAAAPAAPAATGLPIQQIVPPQPQPGAAADGGFGVVGVQPAAAQPLRDQVAPPANPNDQLPF